MRLLTFALNGLEKLGVLTEDDLIIDVSSRDSDPAFRSMQALIEGGAASLERLSGVVTAPGSLLRGDEVRWLAPLPVPTQMRDFLVFETHMRQAGWNGAKLRHSWGALPAPSFPPPIPEIWYQQPIYYKCNRFSVAGPHSVVHWPPYSNVIDYELELACVIGKGGRDISAAEAPQHIFGYTILNDLTARDAQFKEMQGPLGPAKGKDFDGGNILGPVIVTADSLDPSSLTMTARINGEVWSQGSSADMYWSFADIIAHVSRCETLHPGEVLGSGTVGGGCGLELGKFLVDGDLVELEIEGIGSLATRIDAPHVTSRLTL